MTQPQTAPAANIDTLLRQARKLLDKGELAPASATGWQAAARAVADYDRVSSNFEDAARELVKDRRGNTDAGKWLFSAMALRDNAEYDWLDVDGIGRRLDDVQRLVIIIKDIANPPQTAEDILTRSRECLENGYLAPASEKGWEAALWATKTYADAIGCEYRGDEHFDVITRMLGKEDNGDLQVSKCTYAALALREAAAYCTVYPHWLHPAIVIEDIEAVSKLATIVRKLAAVKN